MTDHIIVLAAGRGRRAGGPKALHKVGTELWADTQARRLARTGLPHRWVVSETVARGLLTHDVHVMIPSDETAPMFASIVAGVESIVADGITPRGVFILPVDVPAPEPEMFRRLSVALDETPDCAAAVPLHGGMRGHPVYLSWRLVQERLLGRAVSSEDRLDHVIDALRPPAIEVAVDDPSVLVNLNTADDFAAFASTLNRP